MPRLDREEIDEILRLYFDEGYNQKEVAKKTDHSRNTVSKYVNDIPGWSDYSTTETGPREEGASLPRTSDSGEMIDGGLTATAVEYFEEGKKPSTLAKEAQITLPTALELYEQYQKAETAYIEPSPADLDQRLEGHERLLEELARHLPEGGSLHLNSEFDQDLREVISKVRGEPPGGLLVGKAPDLETCACDMGGVPVFEEGILYCEICGEIVYDFDNDFSDS